jgi:hypothetical protein
MTTHRRSAQKTPTNIGKWAAWYQGLEGPWPYGDTTSYENGATDPIGHSVRRREEPPPEPGSYLPS